MEIDLNELIAKTYQPIKMDKTYIIDEGGRASTKSSKNALLIITTMLEYENCETIVIRQDGVHHRNSTLKELIIACDRLKLTHNVHYQYTVSPLEITLFNSSKIYFGALNDYEKLKGYKPTNEIKYFGLIWFFEISEFKDAYSMEQAISTFSRGGNKKVFNVIYELNPPDDNYHWYFEWVKKVKDEKDYIYNFRTYLDLTKWELKNWLGKHILNQINLLKRIDIEQYNHIYLGMPRMLEDGIYKKLPPTTNRPKRFDFILCGLDYGEQDATTVVAVGVVEDKYYIFDQYYHKNSNSSKKTLLDYKKSIAKWINNMQKEEQCKITLFIETAPMTTYSTFISDDEIDKVIDIYKVSKRKHNQDNRSQIQERIDITNILINSGNLFVCEEELQINKAFAQAVYKKGKRLDDGTTDIDSLDAFEYAILNEFNYIYKKILGGKED